jgi:hypothetical protein
MSQLRDYLRNQLARKVESHGVVVWEDPQREYEQVAPTLAPQGAAFFSWEGSWYELRRRIEPLVSGSTPQPLVVYLPVEVEPEEDPLAELRDAGAVFKMRLATLIRNALAKTLSPTRIAELQQARTLLEAEAALTAGEGTGIRLPAALGTSDPIQLTLRILADRTDHILDSEGLWEEARRVLAHVLGGEPRGEKDALRAQVFRHLVLTELEDALGALPQELAVLRRPATKEQRARARELLRAWRRDIDRLASYRAQAIRIQVELDLGRRLEWREQLAELDTLPILEDLALGEVLRRVQADQAEAAAELAARRLEESVWARGPAPETATWRPRWTAAARVAELLAAIEKTRPPRAKSPDTYLKWYAEAGWRVDRLHREAEVALTELDSLGPLEEAVARARRGYEAWLEELLEEFAAAVEREGLDSTLPRQTSVHREQVAKADRPTAFVLVDALRYELGLELAEVLREVYIAGPQDTLGPAGSVEVSAAVASAPTITPVGMASLLPGAELGIGLDLTAGSLTVSVGGTPVRGVPDRIALLRAAHGEVVDLPLADVVTQLDRELRERLTNARLVLVRSQEIDDVLETDHAAAWRYVKEICRLLRQAIARLTAAGIDRFVLAADHGFLILSRPLGPARVIEDPGGERELHRRCWIGRGGMTPQATLRLPLTAVGISGDLDLLVPRGLAIFGTPGARRFFHGGLSPQELLIPVITVSTRAAAQTEAAVTVRVPGDRVTTGVFSAVLTVKPSLFSAGDLYLRISVRDTAGREVARPVAGDYRQVGDLLVLQGGYAAGTQAVLTFRVTESLRKGDRIRLEVYHGASDRLLGTGQAQVAAEVMVGDELR